MDKILRQNVIDELDYEPAINSADIGVTVENGVVTLLGHVPNYAQKYMAERAVQRVKGVRGIAEELKVDFGGSNPYSDDDIAKRALTVIDLNVLIPQGAIKVKVQDGWLTLSGQVDWNYQRTAAMQDLGKLRGVIGITNEIVISTRVNVTDVAHRIEDAFKRHADVEAKGVRVTSLDGKVKLEGKVATWSDRQAAERAAWAAPGVRSVEDLLKVA